MLTPKAVNKKEAKYTNMTLLHLGDSKFPWWRDYLSVDSLPLNQSRPVLGTCKIR